MSKQFEEIFVSTKFGANLTKGTLIVGTGTDATYVPVGTNNQFLQANSAVASGVQWSGITIGGLSNVILTNLTTGDFLRSNGTFWANTSQVDIFGSFFTEASSDASSSQTGASTAFIVKTTLTTPSLTSTSHKFRIGWYCETNYNDTTNDVIVRILLNNNTANPLGFYQLEQKDTGADQWNSISGFVYVTSLTGVNTITLEFARSAAAGTMIIRRARLEFFRVS